MNKLIPENIQNIEYLILDNLDVESLKSLSKVSKYYNIIVNKILEHFHYFYELYIYSKLSQNLCDCNNENILRKAIKFECLDIFIYQYNKNNVYPKLVDLKKHLEYLRQKNDFMKNYIPYRLHSPYYNTKYEELEHTGKFLDESKYSDKSNTLLSIVYAIQYTNMDVFNFIINIVGWNNLKYYDEYILEMIFIKSCQYNNINLALNIYKMFTILEKDIYEYAFSASCFNNNTKIMNWIYKEYPNMDDEDIFIEHMYDCAQMGLYESFKWMWKNKYEIIKNIYLKLFKIACRFGHVKIMDFIWKRRKKSINICYKNQKLLLKACINGHLSAVEWFTNIKQIDIAYNDYILFEYACQYGHSDIVRFLYNLYIEKSVPIPNTKLEGILDKIIEDSNLKIAKLLLELGTYFNPSYVSVLTKYFKENIIFDRLEMIIFIYDLSVMKNVPINIYNNNDFYLKTAQKKESKRVEEWLLTNFYQ